MSIADPTDVVIVGGGPAGLSAALVLGRCRRSVVVVDAGHRRNAPSRAVHGLYGHDGDDPGAVHARARRDVEGYGVVVIDDAAVAARVDDADGGGFVVDTAGHGALRARKLILATGVVDVMPPVSSPTSPRFRDLLGRGVYVCPYCDGFEHRDQPLLVVGTPALAPELALALRAFSDDVSCVVPAIADDDRAACDADGVRVIVDGVHALEERDGRLHRVFFEHHEPLAPAAVFVHCGVAQASPLAEALGCTVDPVSGVVRTGSGERSGPDGVFVVGDASEDLALVAIAVAEGVRAACAVHTALRKERRR